ncbi:MAG: hypothetical protein K2N70_04705, partial [Helicobacter sp.]|nr:hypothetical protein [Helicobacter sp.]
TRGTTCEAFPLSPFNPQSLARFLFVRYACICQCSTALRLCYALRLEHRRCALWLGRSHDEQWQVKDSIVIASERRERGNQRVMNPKKNPDTVDCHEANASRNDKKKSLFLSF